MYRGDLNQSLPGEPNHHCWNPGRQLVSSEEHASCSNRYQRCHFSQCCPSRNYPEQDCSYLLWLPFQQTTWCLRNHRKYYRSQHPSTFQRDPTSWVDLRPEQSTQANVSFGNYFLAGDQSNCPCPHHHRDGLLPALDEEEVTAGVVPCQRPAEGARLTEFDGAQHRGQEQRSKELAKSNRLSLDNLFEKMQEGEAKSLNIWLVAE